MKRLIVLSLLVLSLVSCKNDKESTEEPVVIEKTTEAALPEGEQLFRGEFMYFGDGAVLSTRSETYAVEINDLTLEMDKAAKALQKTEYDMVNVVVHGKLKTNPRYVETNGDAWEQMVTITKIIEVYPAISANVIKTGKSLDIKEVK